MLFPGAKVKRAPLTPDEATQRDQVRRFLDLLTAVAAVSGALSAVQAVLGGTEKSWAFAIVLGAYTVFLVAWPRRILARGRVEAAVTIMALASTAVIFGTAIIEPSSALIAATSLLIPITASVPYLEVKSLRWLMIVAWVASIATAAASLLPDASAPTSAPGGVGRLWGPAAVSGLVLFLLYQSSERLKASSREFQRLFSLSSDLAENTEPGVLGNLVARHLAEATDMNDCVIYALDAQTRRLTPFGSHPAEHSLETEAESLMERPTLGRVMHDRSRVVVDVSDPQDDATERDRLSALGRKVMLLLPLVAHAEPVGVAELTSTKSRSIDERRLALARTLAFEAAMAIENGRLYHELRERALHDPLTGLANRSLFFDRVSHAIARVARQPDALVAVLYVDLDEFKAVNDTLGHARGDRLLVLVAERLLTAVRGSDTVARLGGDEFALLLEDLASADAALVVAERALSLLTKPFELHGQSVNMSASIGVALRTKGGFGAEALTNEADVAMYEAKRSGKGRVVRSAPVSFGVRGPVA
jgi:diguanylate cyclase (GGDEF)-like protein